MVSIFFHRKYRHMNLKLITQQHKKSSKQRIKLDPYCYYSSLNLFADENNICIFCGAAEQMEPMAPHFEVSRSHTIRQTHTTDRTSPNEWSVHRRGRYLHNTQQTKEMTWAGLEPVMPGIKQLQTYALDPTSTTVRIIPHLNLRYVISYIVSSSSSHSECRDLANFCPS